jgi:hypothetical protein
MNQNGIVFSSAALDEHGSRVKRTKITHPYSYDGFVTYRGGKNEEITGTVYSDRLSQWDHEKTRSLMKKHFGGDGDYYYNREPDQIQSFLSEYFDKKIKLILVMEYCNQSNGFPVWRFDYKEEQ